MKVICIDDTNENEVCPNPILGNTYNVVADTVYMGDEFYGFAEMPPVDGMHFWYVKHRFMPLSSIDETEFERSFNKQTEPA